jgi:hypothetical protein
LEERHSRREKDGHDPELRRARKSAILRINQQHEYEVDVEHRHCCEDDLDVPNLHTEC